MKKIYNYAFQLVCICLLVFTFIFLLHFNLKVENYHTKVQNENAKKTVESTLLVMHQKKKSSTQEEKVSSTKKQIENSIKTEQPVVNSIDTSSFAVLSTETVNISHYGHDCYGCETGYTASGYYVGDGRIYYQDATFGSVRVVAADQKYPIGTILRLGYQGSKIIAIVLDRGGGIGDSQRFQIDLLTASEKIASELGIVQNTSLEVLRLGYSS